MSSFKVFLPRLIQNLKYQWRTFGLVADWSIVVYLLIPLALIGLFIYRSWWLETPDWAVSIPLFLFFLLGYLFSWQGNYRIFSEEADKVFLIKKHDLFFNFKKWSFAYSLLYQAFITVVVLFLLLPFFVSHFNLSAAHITSFFLFLLAMKYLLIYTKYYLRLIQMKILRILADYLVFSVYSSFAATMYILWMDDWIILMNVISIGIIIVSVALYYRLIKKPSSFQSLLAIDREQKLKTAGMIYHFSFEIEKTPVIKRRKPWLFRNSRVIFQKRSPVSGFLELFIKVFLRNKTYLLSYLRMLLLTAVAIILAPPVWVKLLIFVGFVVTVNVWVEAVWDKTVRQHPLMKKYCELDGFFKAKSIMINSMVILSIFLLTVSTSGGWYLYDSFLSYLTTFGGV